jgi:hypothetical protein
MLAATAPLEFLQAGTQFELTAVALQNSLCPRCDIARTRHTFDSLPIEVEEDFGLRGME